MKFAWKDQNIVLFIITISNSREIIKRLRRRPAKIVINTHTSHAIFGEMARKKLSILEFINKYNYYINEVNNTN